MSKKAYIPPRIEIVSVRSGCLMEAGPGIHFSDEFDQNYAEGNQSVFWDDCGEDDDCATDLWLQRRDDPWDE